MMMIAIIRNPELHSCVFVRRLRFPSFGNPRATPRSLVFGMSERVSAIGSRFHLYCFNLVALDWHKTRGFVDVYVLKIQ